jgi:hypothetical protein
MLRLSSCCGSVTILVQGDDAQRGTPTEGLDREPLSERTRNGLSVHSRCWWVVACDTRSTTWCTAERSVGFIILFTDEIELSEPNCLQQRANRHASGSETQLASWEKENQFQESTWLAGCTPRGRTTAHVCPWMLAALTKSRICATMAASPRPRDQSRHR